VGYLFCLCFFFVVLLVMSGLRLFRRPFMGHAFKTKNVARAVNWTRLIFRYEDEKKKASLTSLQSKWAEIRSLHASLPREVKPIDWNYWKKSIRTPGVVDEFKRKYDAELSKEIGIADPDAAQRFAQNETELKRAETVAANAEKKIPALQEEVDEMTWEQNNLEKVDVNYWLKKYPDAHAEFVRQADHAEWFPDPDDEKLETVDYKELRRQLNEGNVRALAAISFLKVRPETRGPFKGATQFSSVDEIIKNYQQSPVWLAHQIELQDKQQ